MSLIQCCCTTTSCPSGSPATKPFHVIGCGNAAVSGATVSLTGAASLSGTTDASGNVSFSLTVLGTYTWSVSATNYATQTGSFTLSSGQCGTTLSTVNVTLSPDSSHFCSCSCCTTLSGSAPHAKLTWPSTLTLNDSVGNVTLTYSGSGTEGCPSGSWTGSATRTSAGTPVTVNFSVQCPGFSCSAGVWGVLLTFDIPSCTPGVTCVSCSCQFSTCFTGTANCDTMSIALSGTMGCTCLHTPCSVICDCCGWLTSMYGNTASGGVSFTITVSS